MVPIVPGFMYVNSQPKGYNGNSLQAWGVRKITLVDSGKVAMSNPLRQSLYTLEDCLDGGDFKALAAVKSLKRIFPAVVFN